MKSPNNSSSSSESDSSGSEMSIPLCPVIRTPQPPPPSSSAGVRGRRLGIQKEDFSYSNTLLPFSLHYHDIILPSNYTIRIDALKNGFRTAIEIAKKAEMSVKKKIIEGIRNITRNRFKKQLMEVIYPFS